MSWMCIGNEKIEIVDGGYILEAIEGKDIVVFDSDGVELARTKRVTIPPEGTLNKWVEMDELIAPKLNQGLLILFPKELLSLKMSWLYLKNQQEK